jgi:hypothetical protein
MLFGIALAFASIAAGAGPAGAPVQNVPLPVTVSAPVTVGNTVPVTGTVNALITNGASSAVPVKVVDAPAQVLNLTDVAVSQNSFSYTCITKPVAGGNGLVNCDNVVSTVPVVMRTIIFRKHRPDGDITADFKATKCQAFVYFSGDDSQFRYFAAITWNADDFASETQVLPVPVRLPANASRRITMTAFGPESVTCGVTVAGLFTNQ